MKKTLFIISLVFAYVLAQQDCTMPVFDKVAFMPAISMGTKNATISLFLPKEPRIYDDKIDVVIQLRGIVPDRFSEGAVNAIIIACDTSGLSEQMNRQFGYQSFVPTITKRALEKSSETYSRALTMNRLAIGSFSAGYEPLHSHLKNSEVTSLLSAVTVFDGIHYGKPGKPTPASMEPFVNFAKKAAANEALMVITHSSIKPPYCSSTDSANYIIEQSGATRRNVTADDKCNYSFKNRYGSIIKPATRADLGGLHVEGYKGAEAKSHIEQIDNLGNVWNEYLARYWCK